MTLAYNLENVSKDYTVGTRHIPVLKNINLQINQGEYAAIIGPSGSGKSTLMQLLGCLDTPSAGSVSILGNNTSRLSDDQSAHLRCHSLGFVFQMFHLLPSYDAVSNVSLAMVYSGVMNRSERAKSLLTQLGLEHRLYNFPTTLSGGEKQRVAIARAMANDPQIILADEPTGALDQKNGQAILLLLDRLHQEGRTIILVTHDMKVAHQAKRVIEIVDGQILRDGPPA